MHLKKILLRTLRKRGLHIRKVTESNDVLTLLKRLHPLNTDIDLIRIGPQTDGGYLLPDDLDGIHACYSPGVGKMSLFEKECLERGMQLFLADYSVDQPGHYDERLHFFKKFVGAKNDEVFMTIEKWLQDTDERPDKDLLLQMDIEGFEFQTILNMSESILSRFRIIVIEFHHFNNLWNKEAFSYMKTAFEKLLSDHYCVHVHVNNCCGTEITQGVELPIAAEFTFHRKDRVKHVYGEAQLPHLLDVKNTPKPDIFLNNAWYQVLN